MLQGGAAAPLFPLKFASGCGNTEIQHFSRGPWEKCSLLLSSLEHIMSLVRLFYPVWWSVMPRRGFRVASSYFSASSCKQPEQTNLMFSKVDVNRTKNNCASFQSMWSWNVKSRLPAKLFSVKYANMHRKYEKKWHWGRAPHHAKEVSRWISKVCLCVMCKKADMVWKRRPTAWWEFQNVVEASSYVQ